METKSINILIIDDNPGDTFLVEQFLVDATGDYHIEKAQSLQEGVLKYKNNQTHIILLDLTLPDSKGIGTFEQIKNEVKDTPIIVLTGLNDEKLAMQAVRTGAQDYLLKDELNGAVLTRSIKYSLERHGAEEKRRWLETKMLYSQKLESLSVLSGDVANNFNSLLTAIIGNSELAMEKIEFNSSAFKNLERIKSSAVEAAELSNQMLAYSGRGRFVVKSLDLSELIEEIKPIIHSTLSDKLEIEYLLGKKLPLIKADIPQMKQLVITLVINATEAIGTENGKIFLRTSKRYLTEDLIEMPGQTGELPRGSYLCLEVEDNGAGVKPEHFEKVFEPFFTTKFTGRGLGLAAAQGIVQGHGGVIKIENAPHSGALLTVLIPEFLA